MATTTPRGVRSRSLSILLVILMTLLGAGASGHAGPVLTGPIFAGPIFAGPIFAGPALAGIVFVSIALAGLALAGLALAGLTRPAPILAAGPAAREPVAGRAATLTAQLAAHSRGSRAPPAARS